MIAYTEFVSRQCNCNGPHVRRFCPQLKQGFMKAEAVDYRRSRSPPRKVTFQTQEPEVLKKETAKDQNTEPRFVVHV